jgi:hypothetical protein
MTHAVSPDSMAVIAFYVASSAGLPVLRFDRRHCFLNSGPRLSSIDFGNHLALLILEYGRRPDVVINEMVK